MFSLVFLVIDRIVIFNFCSAKKCYCVSTALLFLRYIVVTIVAGFQTVAIFMQTGEPGKSDATVTTVSDIIKDSHHKVCIII